MPIPSNFEYFAVVNSFAAATLIFLIIFFKSGEKSQIVSILKGGGGGGGGGSAGLREATASTAKGAIKRVASLGD